MSSYRMKYKIGATQYHIPVMDDISGFGSGVPLGTVLPYSANSQYPPEGFLWCDGSAVSRTAYPDLFALIGITYGSGDGSTTFNLPDLGFVDTKNSSIELKGRAPVWGDEVYTPWADKPSWGNTSISWTSSNYMVVGSGSTCASAYLGDSKASAELSNTTTAIRYIIKAFSATTSNSELVDVTALSTEITKKFDPSTDFCFVYPNGGTAENPANVTNNTRYVETNPFPGYEIKAVAELYINSEWGEWDNTTFSGGSSAQGIVTSVYGDNIIIQTASYSLFGGAIFDGNPFQGAAHVFSAPCRIKVWKIGKIPQSS